MAVFVYGPETVENTRVFGFPNAAAGVAQPGISQRRVGGENGRKSGCRAAPFRKWTRVYGTSAPLPSPTKSALREKVLLFRGGRFCIKKTTGSAGGSKKLSLCPEKMSERSKEQIWKAADTVRFKKADNRE